MVRIINPRFEILRMTADALGLIEQAGRTCYKSEEKIVAGSAKTFAEMILARGHESVIEHAMATVKFVHNRGFTHELVRHRIASFSQESTRYCNYACDKFGNEITVIMPYWYDPYQTHDPRLVIWMQAMQTSEDSYFAMLKPWVTKDESGKEVTLTLVPQAARGVLPNDLKTEIVITANFREWRHIFALRTSNAAHPDMLRVMKPLLAEFQHRVPVLFDKIGAEDEK